MEKLLKKYPVLGSSADPNKVSLSIKSLVSAVIPVLVILLKGRGVDVSETDLVDLMAAIWAALSAVGVVIGLVRKLYYKLKN